MFNTFIHNKLHFYSLSCNFLCRDWIGLVPFLVSVAFRVYAVDCPNLGHHVVGWTYKAVRLKELDVISCQFSRSLNVEKHLDFFQVISLCSTRWFDRYASTPSHHSTFRQASFVACHPSRSCSHSCPCLP